MHYRITDTARPGEYLDLELEVEEDEDPDDVEVNEDQAEQILEWWSDPVGRGYLVMDDGYIILANVSHGEPEIVVWYQVDRDDSWPLSGFPFASLDHRVVDQ